MTGHSRQIAFRMLVASELEDDLTQELLGHAACCKPCEKAFLSEVTHALLEKTKSADSDDVDQPVAPAGDTECETVEAMLGEAKDSSRFLPPEPQESESGSRVGDARTKAFDLPWRPTECALSAGREDAVAKHIRGVRDASGIDAFDVDVLYRRDFRWRSKWWVSFRIEPPAAGDSLDTHAVSLKKFDGRLVRIQRKTIASGDSDPIDALFELDASGSYLFGTVPLYVDDPNEPDWYAMSALDRAGSVRAGPRLAEVGLATDGGGDWLRPTTVIPLVGGPIPEVTKEPEELRQLVERQPPHWFYHVHIRRSEGVDQSDVRWILPKHIRFLVESLGLESDSRSGYHVQPLELVRDDMPAPHEISRYGFPVRSAVEGRSFMLPLALGLAAARTDRPLPNWIMATGETDQSVNEMLSLSDVGWPIEKLRLAMGDPSEYDCSLIIDRLYNGPDPTRFLGPKGDRMVSGSVRLALLPKTQYGMPTHAFEVETLDASWDDFGCRDFAELRTVVDDLANGDLLVVEVSTIWEALRVLGYHELIRDIGSPRANTALWGDRPNSDLRVLRIRPRSAFLPPRDKRRTKLDARIAACKWELDRRLALENDFHRSMRMALQYISDVAGCRYAEMRVTDGKDRTRLRHVQRWEACSGSGPPEIWYTPAVGIHGRVMKTGKTHIAVRGDQETVFGESDFGTGYMERLRADYPYHPDLVDEYSARLDSFGACLVAPLKNGNEVIGTVSLYRPPAQNLESDVADVAELIEALVAHLSSNKVVAIWRQNRFVVEVQRNRDPSRLMGSVACMLKDNASPDIEELPRSMLDFGEELACLVGQQAEAPHVGVWFLVPEIVPGEDYGIVSAKNQLILIGEDGSYRDSADGQSLPKVDLADDEIAAAVISSGESRVIPDVAQSKPANRCDDPKVRSRLVIPLGAGTRVLGVVKVDWRHTGACDTGLQQDLESLTNRYALVLRALHSDWLLVALNSFLDNKQSAPLSQEDYGCILRHFTAMVGAQRGAVFLRDRNTGQYRLATAIGHPEWAPEAEECKWYEPGLGLTGYVIERNRPIRVQNVEDADELRRIDRELHWRRWCSDVPDHELNNSAWMGVPISVGDEVLGVLRVASPEYLPKFGAFDQQVAMAVAARLAGHIYYHESEPQRKECLRELAEFLPEASKVDELSAKVSEALQQGLGACSWYVRTVDMAGMQGDPPSSEVLRRFAASERAWTADPKVRCKGQGVAGVVWECRKSIVFDDLEKQRTLDESLQQDAEICGSLGSGSLVCTPVLVNDEVVGTVTVHREHRRSLSSGDLRFINDVAGLTGHALRSVEHGEGRELRLKLNQATQQYLLDLMKGRSAADAEADLAQKIVDAVIPALRGRNGCGWLLEPRRCHFKYSCGDEANRNCRAEIPASLEGVFGKERVVVNPEWIVEGLPHCRPCDAEACENWQHVALMMEAAPNDARFAMLFLVVIRPDDHFTLRHAGEVADILQGLAPSIALGRHYAQQHAPHG